MTVIAEIITIIISLYPFANDTAGTWHNMAVQLTKKIGRCITIITEDTKESTLLFQRLFIALQRRYVVSFHNTTWATTTTIIIIVLLVTRLPKVIWQKGRVAAL